MRKTLIVAREAGTSSRTAVRELYKRVLKLGNTWEARNPSQTPKEREYILEEARTLFHEHMHETDLQRVQRLKSVDERGLQMQEAEGRVEIAEHYRIPYQRASNLPPGTSADDHRRGHTPISQVPRYTPPGHPVFDD